MSRPRLLSVLLFLLLLSAGTAAVRSLVADHRSVPIPVDIGGTRT